MTRLMSSERFSVSLAGGGHRPCLAAEPGFFSKESARLPATDLFRFFQPSHVIERFLVDEYEK